MPTIWTIGHGTAAIEDLIATLRAADITAVADVRRFAASRRNPQFGAAALPDSLREAGIDYVHLGGLGGRRRPVEGSPHTGLRVAAFRAYADHMATDEFAADRVRLTALAGGRRTAFLCAEALWWRCHRRLLADRLGADGWTVLHLRVGAAAEPHRRTDAARVEQGRLLYDLR